MAMIMAMTMAMTVLMTVTATTTLAAMTTTPTTMLTGGARLPLPGVRPPRISTARSPPMAFLPPPMSPPYSSLSGFAATKTRLAAVPSLSSASAPSSFSPPSSSSSSRSPRVERVAIIGAGISGLALAHALTSGKSESGVEVTLFDARSSFDESSGSGIQLTGGMAALRAIDPELQRKVARAAIPFEGVVSRCRPWFSSSEAEASSADPGFQLLELDVQDAIRKSSAAAAAASDDSDGSVGLVTEEGEVMAHTILRGTLQRILREELVDKAGIDVRFGKALTGIEYIDSDAASDTNGQGIVCRFDDGTSSGPFDLVAGCDGIKSVVKDYVDFGETTPSEDSAGGSAIYSGIRITFAIRDGKEGDAGNAAAGEEGAQFAQAFGNGAYALTSQYGAGEGAPPAEGAFLIYGDKDYFGPFRKGKDLTDEAEDEATSAFAASSIVDEHDSEDTALLDENTDWALDNRVTREHVEECLGVLNQASVPGSDAARIVSSADRFFDLGVYFHNPFRWNGWNREVLVRDSDSGGWLGNLVGGKVSKRTGRYCVLVGDAAHAMPPFLGQGANQAMQDAYLLAQKIREHNSKALAFEERGVIVEGEEEMSDLKILLEEYERRRWAPTASITVKAVFLGYLEVGSGFFAKFRDVFFFTMGKIGVVKKVFMDSATPKI